MTFRVKTETTVKPHLLLINPWIYDFAAYDLWSNPLGMLSLAGYLRRLGFEISLIDCLDNHHPSMSGCSSMIPPRKKRYGIGNFWREQVPRPDPLKYIQRPYSRYGISKEVFQTELERADPPSAILITSLMTYWYPGVQEAISLAKARFPEAPVILGGIYARLCTRHAVHVSGADHVITGWGMEALASLLRLLKGYGIESESMPSPLPGEPYPAFDLLHQIDSIALLTSSGCPYRCSYCASRYLQPLFSQRDPREVAKEILYWHKYYGIRDFAFYDDALLIDKDCHIIPLLERVIDMNLSLRFHTPNALHVRGITQKMALLLHQAGFRTIRLGLETSHMGPQRDLDSKVSAGEFEMAVLHLGNAGFTRREIGAYILAGLPGQSVESVRDTITFVGETGADPYLAEYSPIPHTPLWETARAHSEYDLAAEPLFHNNTLLPCWDTTRRERYRELKQRVLQFRKSPINPL